MTMISDLPVHLVEEIVSRVPLKSMRAVRLTSKRWDTLSKSRSFSKMHIAKTTALKEGESMMVAMIDYNLHLISVVLGVDGDPSIQTKGTLTCHDEQVNISQVFHCDGLLLCVLDEDDTKVVVWNPYWGQTRCIESRYFHRPKGCGKFSYALGYEDKNSCRSYKLLRFIDQSYPVLEERFFWYEIYDFDSGLWRTLDVTPHWHISYFDRGVSLKGNTYWGASKSNEQGHIICFDFTNERFGPLLRLPFNAGINDSYVTLSCVREEKLAVFLTHNEQGPEELEIWISTKIEAEKVSWSKFLKRDTEPFYPLITCDSFLIDEEKKVAMGFEEDNTNTFNIIGEGEYFRELDLGERNTGCRAHACSYVPSLVQIKQPAAGGKRKQQSDLEKHRCDENMSRLVALEKRSKYEEGKKRKKAR